LRTPVLVWVKLPVIEIVSVAFAQRLLAGGL
jgi:hypothetical protein